MSGQGMPVVFFCLATGAALGCLFLLCRTVCGFLRLGKWGVAAVDLLFCCFCGGFVFLCALAVDSGRLRLYQAGLQSLGAWAAVAALGPWQRKAVRVLEMIFCKVRKLFGKWMGLLHGLFSTKTGPKKSLWKKS